MAGTLGTPVNQGFDIGKAIEGFVTSPLGQVLLALGSLIPGPIGEFIRKIGVPVSLAIAQDVAQKDTKEETEALFTEAKGEVTTNRVNIQNMLAGLRGDVQGKLTADKNRLTSLLEGLGETERGDINRQFTEFSADATSGLQERGLGTTSVVSGVQGGIEERRTRSLAGLKERLRNARFGIESEFSRRSTSAMERLGLAGVNFQNINTADLVNLLASKNIIGPDQGIFLGLESGLGGAFAPKAPLPSLTDTLVAASTGESAGAASSSFTNALFP